MSRLPSGASSVTNSYDSLADELETSELEEIIIDLRRSLGAIPQIAQVYGVADEDEDSSLSISEDDPAPRPYSTTLRDDDSLAESEAEEPNKYDDFANLRDGAAAVPAASSNKYDDVGDVGANAPYILNEQGQRAPAPSGGLGASSDDDISISEDDDDAFDPLAPTPTAEQFEKTKRETSKRLARLRKFFSAESMSDFDGAFATAVGYAVYKNDAAFAMATAALGELNETLDENAPRFRREESEFLREQIRTQLADDCDMLIPADKKDLEDRFDDLDDDIPVAEKEAEDHLQGLRTLTSDIGAAVEERIRSIASLNVDYERLQPVTKQALDMESDHHDALATIASEVDAGFAGKFAEDGLEVTDIRAKLDELRAALGKVLSSWTMPKAMAAQKDRLPASPGSLKPEGAALGKGAFGEVFALKSDGDKALVGKTFDPSKALAKRTVENEVAAYAKIGEHPNIAKCYGIHDVDDGTGAKPMLVMEKIEGKDVEKVFDDLDKDYRNGDITREQYLGSIQHIFKGTLQGLAHMQSMGVVHKDIKGDNVKFDTRTNSAVLIDMGLAQPEGAPLNAMAYAPIVPPEGFVNERGDKSVTSLWDSFTVGKMLFEEMERDQAGQKYVAVSGGEAFAKPAGGAFTRGQLDQFRAGASKSMDRTGPSQFVAKTDDEGDYVGDVMHEGDSPADARKAGKYGVETQYVDFMKKLMHPDPAQRLSPIDALKHPFITDSLLSPEQLEGVFGKAGPAEPAQKVEVVGYGSSSDAPVPYKVLEGDGDSSSEEGAEESIEQVYHPLTEDNLAASGAYDVQDDSVLRDDLSEVSSDDSSEGVNVVNQGYTTVANPGYDPMTGPPAELDDEESEDEESASGAASSSGRQRSSSRSADAAGEGDDAPVAPAKKAESAAAVAAKLKAYTTPLQRWEVAVQAVEQQFNAAYSNFNGDKAKLKAAGFTKGDKLSKYFTYNKDLDKRITALEKSLAKNGKDVAKLKTKVLEATAHYREKITAKATEDFGWANAKPAVKPAFWNTLVAALDDVDEWVNS